MTERRATATSVRDSRATARLLPGDSSAKGAYLVGGARARVYAIDAYGAAAKLPPSESAGEIARYVAKAIPWPASARQAPAAAGANPAWYFRVGPDSARDSASSETQRLLARRAADSEEAKRLSDLRAAESEKTWSFEDDDDDDDPLARRKPLDQRPNPIEVLGGGAFGCTFRGTYRAGGPLVALKLQESAASDGATRRRLRNEYSIGHATGRLAELKAAPSFVRYHKFIQRAAPDAFRYALSAAGGDGGRLCRRMRALLTRDDAPSGLVFSVMAMDEADGGTLASMMRDGGLRTLWLRSRAAKTASAFPWAKYVYRRAASDVARTLIASLVVAYQQLGFTHGDIKPENVGFVLPSRATLLQMEYYLGESTRITTLVGAAASTDASDAIKPARVAGELPAPIEGDGTRRRPLAVLDAAVYAMPGVPVLLDMGAARMFGRSKPRGRGTPAYRSLLEFLGWQPATPCYYDAYALCIMMLELARGDPIETVFAAKGLDDDGDDTAGEREPTRASGPDSDLWPGFSRPSHVSAVKRSLMLAYAFGSQTDPLDAIVKGECSNTELYWTLREPEWLQWRAGKRASLQGGARADHLRASVKNTYGADGLAFVSDVLSMSAAARGWEWSAGGRALRRFLQRDMDPEERLTKTYDALFTPRTKAEKQSRSAITGREQPLVKYDDRNSIPAQPAPVSCDVGDVLRGFTSHPNDAYAVAPHAAPRGLDTMDQWVAHLGELRAALPHPLHAADAIAAKLKAAHPKKPHWWQRKKLREMRERELAVANAAIASTTP